MPRMPKSATRTISGRVSRTEAVRHFHAEAVILKKYVADTGDEHARFHRFCFPLIWSLHPADSYVAKDVR